MTLIKCVRGGGLTADVATSTALAACLLHRQLYVYTGDGRSIPRHTVSRGNLIFHRNSHKRHTYIRCYLFEVFLSKKQKVSTNLTNEKATKVAPFYIINSKRRLNKRIEAQRLP